MPIETTIETDADLTVHVCSGVVDLNEVGERISRFYDSPAPTRLILWDLSRARVGEISSEQIRRLVAATTAHAHRRPGGRTAIVVGTDLAYGLARMFEVFQELAGSDVTHAVFRDVGSARSWLRSGERRV